MGDTRNTNSKWLIFFSGVVGGIVAVLADIMMKENASAIRKIHEAAINVLELSWFKPYMAAFIIIGLAVAMCLIFLEEMDTAPKAFYLGASILAIIMTLTPYKSPSNTLFISPSPSRPQDTSEEHSWLDLLAPSTAFAFDATVDMPWLSDDYVHELSRRPRLTIRIIVDASQEERLADGATNMWVRIKDPRTGATHKSAQVTVLFPPLSPSFNEALEDRAKWVGTYEAWIFTALDGEYVVDLEIPGFRIEKKRTHIRYEKFPEPKGPHNPAPLIS